MTSDDIMGRATAWVTERLSYFSVHRAQTERLRLEAIKRLGELALAGSLAQPRREKLGTLWQETAWELLDRGAVLAADLARHPTLAVVCALFAAGGRRNDAIEACVRSEAWLAEARRSPRELRFALYFALESMGVKAPESWAPYYALEPLSRHVPVEWLNDADAYAITHAAGWLTDFGKRPLGEPDRTYLFEIAPQLVERALGFGNTDLLAEGMLAMHCARDVAPAEAWEALAASQAASGVVVRGLTHMPETWLRGRSEGEIFLAHLHPTFATIMACATTDAVGF